MMEEKDIEPVQLIDFEGFYNELQNETPRASVIIAAAFMDRWLRQLIANFMIRDSKIVNELLGTDENADCPLSSFSSRIKAAYCLGLINKHEYHDLNIVRKIRNHFAHGIHGLSFDDKKVVSWCNSLWIPKKIMDSLGDHVPKSHREKFLVGVALLITNLRSHAMEIKDKRRTIPKDFELARVIQVSGEKSKRTE